MAPAKAIAAFQGKFTKQELEKAAMADIFLHKKLPNH
jgi:hypothetical protein